MLSNLREANWNVSGVILIPFEDFWVLHRPQAPNIEDRAHPSIRMRTVALRRSYAGSMLPRGGCMVSTMSHAVTMRPHGGCMPQSGAMWPLYSHTTPPDFIPYTFHDSCGLHAPTWVPTCLDTIKGAKPGLKRGLLPPFDSTHLHCQSHREKVFLSAN